MERATPVASLSWVFLGVALAGAVVPLAVILPWLSLHGLDAARFMGELFSNRVSAFFVWDVVISAVAVLIATFSVPGVTTAQRLTVSASTLLIGVSCGLPLLLFFWTRRGAMR